jgi:MFS family permease
MHQNQQVPQKGAMLALIAAFLGWFFDGFEIGLFPVIARPALRSLLTEGGEGAVGQWMGYITAAFLVGAAFGGAVFGWLGDKIGRVRSMSLSILTYSLFSAAGYFADAPWHLAACRFVSALGMGGEWALGVALIMEVWPENKRPYLAGAIGTAANCGMLLIALIARKIPVTPESWRWVFLVGAAPAVITLLIRFFVPESERWHQSRKDVQTGKMSHLEYPMAAIFSRALRRKTVIGIILSAVALIGTWGSVQWIPLWADELAGPTNPGAKANAQLMLTVGAVVGSLLAPILCAKFSRRLGFFLLCALSLAVCQLMFRLKPGLGETFFQLTILCGLITAAFYGFFPLYLPEFFPTAVRATGQGVAYNTGRFVAAFGAVLGGELVKLLGGYANAGAIITLVYAVGMIVIWFAPETHGKPLPE